MGLFSLFRKASEKNENKAVTVPSPQSNDMVGTAEAMLAEVNVDLSKADAVRLPIATLGALGGGVASLLPALRTVSSTFSYTDQGLYRCIFPKGVNGYLATAHSDGLSLGTIINNKGIAGQARWVKAGEQEIKVSSVAPINPATLMMAAALVEIDKKLDDIIALEKQILSFLEEDKEAKIEGDLKTLTTILREYKFNWDNAMYTTAHYKLAADIKRSAEGNIIFYQKRVADVLKETPVLFLQRFVDSTQASLIKNIQYFRFSVYIFAFASFLEVMLQGQYREAYIEHVRQ